MLVKLTTGVNHTNCKWAAFSKKMFSKLFTSYSLALWFVAERISAQKVLIKCCWNWLQNDPFSGDNVIVIQSNQTVEQIRPTIEQIIPTFEQIRPTIEQTRPTIEQIGPNVDQTTPTTTVVIIEKNSNFNLLPEKRPTIFHRRKLFRLNGLENPYLNYHFKTSNYFHSRVKK